MLGGSLKELGEKFSWGSLQIIGKDSIVKSKFMEGLECWEDI